MFLHPIDYIRRQRIPCTQRVLGVLVVVWANLMLAPGAMAVDYLHEHNRIQCSPGAPRELPLCDARVVQDARSQVIPCEVGRSGCKVHDQYLHDDGTARATVKDSSGNGAAAITSNMATFPISESGHPTGLDVSTRLPGIPVSLNILYCTFLR
jgi:hypothetical protein